MTSERRPSDRFDRDRDMGGRGLRGDRDFDERGASDRRHDDPEVGERRYDGERGMGERSGSGRSDQGRGRTERGGAFGLGPKGYRRSDERLYDDIGQRLTEDPVLDARDIEIEVQKSEVILRGTVDSREAKRRAEDIVDDVAGVSDVRNELRVRREGGFLGMGGREREQEGRIDTATGRRTVAGVFDDVASAQRAMEELRGLGIHRDRISFITRDTREGVEGKVEAKKDSSHVAGPAGAGALLGGLAGGALGWLLGIGAIAIPGIGPVIAAGALATALGGAVAGAAAGGLVGALVSLGIPESEARDYERRVREGAVLVTVSGVSDDLASSVKEVFERFGGHDVRSFEGKDRHQDPERARGNGQPVGSRR